jgi:hypothetical protein
MTPVEAATMKRTIACLMASLLLSASLISQSGSINNTLGSGGSFNIKDNSTTFLSLNQSNGNLSLAKDISLTNTSSSTTGVITKGGSRFIHDFQPAGSFGFNTFVGVNSGNFSMSGTNQYASWNTAVGNSCLSLLTTGFENSAFGAFCLQNLTTGNANSGFGYNSLTQVSDGQYNSAFGCEALQINNSVGNSAFGFASLDHNVSDGNSAFGAYTLVASTGGAWNSAFGYASLYNTTGSTNSAFGFQAGENITSGSNNTCVGYNSQPSSATVSNEITLGNSSVATLRCQVTSITSLSDARDKKNIRDLAVGIDFLMKIRPREFNWDRRELYKDGKPNGSRMQKSPAAGFIAQEIDEVQTKEGVEWLNLVLKSNPDRLEATPGNLLPVMVKAIQDLKTENDLLKARLSRFEQAQQLLAGEIEKLKSNKSQNNSELSGTK